MTACLQVDDDAGNQNFDEGNQNLESPDRVQLDKAASLIDEKLSDLSEPEDLFGDEVELSPTAPTALGAVGKVKAKATIDPLDLANHPQKSALDAAFLEDDSAKMEYLKNLAAGVQCIPLDLDYGSPFEEKLLTWTTGPFIPIGENQLAGVDTFVRMALDEESYNECLAQALAHVLNARFWSAHANGGADALQVPKGTLFSCSKLGELVDMKCAGTCDTNLMIGQVKGHNSKATRPTNGCMIFCHEHLKCGGGASANAQRCIRMVPYFLFLMQQRIAQLGGAMMTDDIEKYRKYFMARKPLVTALLVTYMTNQNWVSKKLGEKLAPFRKHSVTPSRASNTSTPSVADFYSMKGKKAPGVVPPAKLQWGKGNADTPKGKGKPSPGSAHNAEKGKGKGKGSLKGSYSGKIKPMQYPDDVGSGPQHRDLNPSDSKKRHLEMQLNTVLKAGQVSDEQLAAILAERMKKKAKGPDQK